MGADIHFIIRKQGFQFTFNSEACKECKGRCCNGESGNIFVTKKEIISISEFLKIETRRFVERYLRKEVYQFSIKEIKSNQNYACIFFDTKMNRCSIYPVRPKQCRTFPFWEYYRDKPEALSKECPGVSFERV